MTYSVVWFKRDLRVEDHEALLRASRQGPVLCLYVIEPSFWRQPDASARHYLFLLECLRELDVELRRRGGRLNLVVGEVVDIFECIFVAAPFQAIHSHEETGNAVSFERDQALGRWCLSRGVAWREYPQFGVVRRLKSRDMWQAEWEARVSRSLLAAPARGEVRFVPLPWDSALPPSPVALELLDQDPPKRQAGGRRAALSVLQSFLTDRGGRYRGGISSPLSAPSACSRLSPYLAYGCLSLREVVQATRAEVLRASEVDIRRKQGLTAFLSRLYWHCHFIQKLESEPALEYRNMHRGYDGLREDDWSSARFDTLVGGRTGWPLVDACVVMLRETGWLNFRMRAMLVSVAAYPLWLHWRPVGLWLARQFLDYEPGIHWSQLQMQSGTTGINTTRVYNPIKQARDHDPDGRFVRKWLPAMRKVPDVWLFEPWRMPLEIQERCGLRVGTDIPLPVVDLELATREAKQKLHACRAQPDVRAAKAAIVRKHGSRKRPQAQQRGRKDTGAADKSQMSLDFD